MSTSIVQLASEKLNGDNYGTWKSNLNTILVIDNLRFVLTEECPVPAQNANRTVRDVHDRWTKANEKAKVYILASISDILSKKHEKMVTAKEIMDSLQALFGQPSSSAMHDAIKYVYNCRMKEGTNVREHVLDMMVHFNIAEVNGAVMNEKSQVGFIMESLPKSFFQFRTNAMMNKIDYNLTTLLNELQIYQSLLKNKGSEVEANVATTSKRRFQKGSTSGNKSVLKNKGIQKKKGKGKGKTPPTTTAKGKKPVVEKGKCFYCSGDGHWKRNCPKYLADKKAGKENQGKYDLMVLETCIVENNDSTWILDSGATNHVCSSFQETSSWKQLEDGEITLRIGSGELISTLAVGDVKLFFGNRYIYLEKCSVCTLLQEEFNIYFLFD